MRCQFTHNDSARTRLCSYITGMSRPRVSRRPLCNLGHTSMPFDASMCSGAADQRGRHARRSLTDRGVGIHCDSSCMCYEDAVTRSGRNMQMRCWECKTKHMFALLAGSLIACSSDARREPTPTPRYIVADVIISVANETPRVKRIFLEAGPVEHILGDVPANSSRSFSVPGSAADSTNELRLEARARATSNIRSATFVMSSGKRVVWTLDKAGHESLVSR